MVNMGGAPGTASPFLIQPTAGHGGIGLLAGPQGAIVAGGGAQGAECRNPSCSCCLFLFLLHHLLLFLLYRVFRSSP